MSPAFGASARKLADLKREWEQLLASRSLLMDFQHSLSGEKSTKRWIVNAALSSGVSGLYTGMEDVLRGLISKIDGSVPAGPNSHQELLEQASISIGALRPAILSEPSLMHC